MSVLHKSMATGLIALTLTASSLTTATPAHAGSDDEFWGGVAAGAIGGLLLSQAVRPGYYYDYPAYGGYAGYGGYGGYGGYYRPYAYARPYYNSYYRPYYYRPYSRPYYRSYYRPYYRNYGYCGVERRYDHRSDVWVNVRVCPRY